MKKLNNKISIAGFFLFCTIVVGFVFVQTPLNLAFIPDGGDPPLETFSWITRAPDQTCGGMPQTISLTWKADSGYWTSRWTKLERSPHGLNQWTEVGSTQDWDNYQSITYTVSILPIPPGETEEYDYRVNFHDSSGDHRDTAIVTVDGSDWTISVIDDFNNGQLNGWDIFDNGDWAVVSYPSWVENPPDNYLLSIVGQNNVGMEQDFITYRETHPGNNLYINFQMGFEGDINDGPWYSEDFKVFISSEDRSPFRVEVDNNNAFKVVYYCKQQNYLIDTLFTAIEEHMYDVEIIVEELQSIGTTNYYLWIDGEYKGLYEGDYEKIESVKFTHVSDFSDGFNSYLDNFKIS